MLFFFYKLDRETLPLLKFETVTQGPPPQPKSKVLTLVDCCKTCRNKEHSMGSLIGNSKSVYLKLLFNSKALSYCTLMS